MRGQVLFTTADAKRTPTHSKPSTKNTTSRLTPRVAEQPQHVGRERLGHLGAADAADEREREALERLVARREVGVDRVDREAQELVALFVMVMVMVMVL